MACYISIKKFNLNFVLKLESGEKKRKYGKHLYFVLFNLKTHSPFNSTLKYMHNMLYIQALFIRQTIHLMDTGS